VIIIDFLLGQGLEMVRDIMHDLLLEEIKKITVRRKVHDTQRLRFCDQTITTMKDHFGGHLEFQINGACIRDGSTSATGVCGGMDGVASLNTSTSIGSKAEQVEGYDTNAYMVCFLGGRNVLCIMSRSHPQIFPCHLIVPITFVGTVLCHLDNFPVGVRGYKILIFTVNGA
jgi:hypothetical protein